VKKEDEENALINDKLKWGLLGAGGILYPPLGLLLAITKLVKYAKGNDKDKDTTPTTVAPPTKPPGRPNILYFL
jgi:hypothetical protein